jgi:polyvinyl alcohol dehydrogenase (cytochrome)
MLPTPTDCPDPNARQTCHSGNWAGATAIPGAVFTGSRDGTLRAFSSKDGKIIWEFKTSRPFDTVNGVPGNGGGIGGPGPTVAGGMLFTGSGYAILSGAPGNVLLAFEPQ